MSARLLVLAFVSAAAAACSTAPMLTAPTPAPAMESPSPSPSPTPVPVPDPVARYVVTFQSDWSRATHPTNWPDDAHYSGLIGGTHSSRVTFWQEGQVASPGIQLMAEQGRKSPLDQEVLTAISAGTAQFVLSGGGLSGSPRSVSLEFDVSVNFPLVTLVSMIAPSPDWFVGVSGLDLQRDGGWVDELVVELQPYDAGTDSGGINTSPDEVTVPFWPISHLTTGPFASGLPLGTFTFTRTDRPTGPQFIRGDSNGDGARDLTDAVLGLNSLFQEGQSAPCRKSLDVDDNGTVDITDPIALLAYLFLGGPPPAEPLSACGRDLTA